MKLYELRNKFYPTKQEAIDQAKKLASPEWYDEAHQFVYNPENEEAKITIVDLSNSGQVCELLNNKSAPTVGVITVTSDMSLREIQNSEAKITFTIKKENFND